MHYLIMQNGSTTTYSKREVDLCSELGLFWLVGLNFNPKTQTQSDACDPFHTSVYN